MTQEKGKGRDGDDVLARINRVQDGLAEDQARTARVEADNPSVEDLKDGVSAIATLGRWSRKAGSKLSAAGNFLKNAFHTARDGVAWTSHQAKRLASGEMLEQSPFFVRWPVKTAVVWPAKALGNTFKWATIDKNDDGNREIDWGKLGLRSRYFGFPEFTKDINWGKAAWRIPTVALLSVAMVNGARYGAEVAYDGIPMMLNSQEITYVMHGGADRNADGIFEAKGFIGENTNENTYHFEIQDNAYIDLMTRLEGIGSFDLDKIFDGYDPKFVADQVPTEEQACRVNHHGFYSRFLDRDLQVTAVNCSSSIQPPAPAGP